MNNKRVMSSLIPYRKRGSEFEYCLQRRSKDAKINPGMFGMWGGKAVEGETPEQTLIREIQEELAYNPQHFQYFCRYELSRFVFNVFIEEVEEGFESKIQILEGDYATFMNLTEIIGSKEMSPNATMIFEHLDAFLTK